MAKPKKDHKIMILVIGGYFVFTGGFMMAYPSFQADLMELNDVPTDQMPDIMGAFYQTWQRVMPWLALIGIGMLGFGVMVDRWQKQALGIHLAFTLLTLVWAAFYGLESHADIQSMMGFFPDQAPQAFSTFMEVIFWFSALTTLLMVLIPMIIIAVKLKRLQAAEEEAML
ncbi:MAG: hypothetical protein AAGB22_05240 [Bacteroidota bacterium]